MPSPPAQALSVLPETLVVFCLHRDVRAHLQPKQLVPLLLSYFYSPAYGRHAQVMIGDAIQLINDLEVWTRNRWASTHRGLYWLGGSPLLPHECVPTVLPFAASQLSTDAIDALVRLLENFAKQELPHPPAAVLAPPPLPTASSSSLPAPTPSSPVSSPPEGPSAADSPSPTDGAPSAAPASAAAAAPGPVDVPPLTAVTLENITALLNAMLERREFANRFVARGGIGHLLRFITLPRETLESLGTPASAAPASAGGPDGAAGLAAAGYREPAPGPAMMDLLARMPPGSRVGLMRHLAPGASSSPQQSLPFVALMSTLGSLAQNHPHDVIAATAQPIIDALKALSDVAPRPDAVLTSAEVDALFARVCRAVMFLEAFSQSMTNCPLSEVPVDAARPVIERCGDLYRSRERCFPC